MVEAVMISPDQVAMVSLDKYEKVSQLNTGVVLVKDRITGEQFVLKTLSAN